MNYFVFFKGILVCVFLSLKVFSLEVSVPINIYPPLSKTISMPVVGSSNTVIESNELDKYQNLPIHDILNMETSINSRSIYGTNSSGNKTTIDIRGMGAQAKSNVLILINGQRLNNIDMSEIDFPSIPSQSIDRVEIIKGNAASVLYGDGAIGGAINIITNPELNKKNINEIVLRTGTYNKREIVWKNFTKLENYSFSTIFNHDETDGYRDENEQQQNNFTSEIRYPGSLGQHLMIFNYSEQIMSTPSDRDQDQLYSDRRGSDTPDDYINSEGISLLYSSDYKLKDYTDFIFNSSFRLKNSFSDLQSSSFPSYNDTALTNYQITPRINQKTNILGKIVSSIYGLDLLYADYKSYRKQDENAIPLHVYDARQSSYSAYLQQSIYLSNFSTLGIGFRFQRNYIEIGDHLERNAPDYAGWQTEHKTLSDQETNYAIKLRDTQGKQIPVLLYSVALLIVLPLLSFLFGGVSLGFEIPELKKLSKISYIYEGGISLPPELIALVLALSLYTSTFVAECVRAGIEGVSKGQKEAAASVGLTPNQVLKLVIMPQALRIIIPPTTNQYLNLTKNSSLAAAIAYPDLVLVFAGTALMQTGKAIEIVSITMLTYLTISLTIAAIMNWYNKKIEIKEK